MVGRVYAGKQSTDNNWYRARVEQVSGPSITVRYIDYGNKETVTVSDLRELEPAMLEPHVTVSLVFS